MDIGAQMAGIKVLTSLDIEKDAIATLRANDFFSHTEHRLDDIRNVTAKDYDRILKINNPVNFISTRRYFVTFAEKQHKNY